MRYNPDQRMKMGWNCALYWFHSPHHTISPLSNDIYNLVISTYIEGCVL